MNIHEKKHWNEEEEGEKTKEKIIWIFGIVSHSLIRFFFRFVEMFYGKASIQAEETTTSHWTTIEVRPSVLRKKKCILHGNCSKWKHPHITMLVYMPENNDNFLAHYTTHTDTHTEYWTTIKTTKTIGKVKTLILNAISTIFCVFLPLPIFALCTLFLGKFVNSIEPGKKKLKHKWEWHSFRGPKIRLNGICSVVNLQFVHCFEDFFTDVLPHRSMVYVVTMPMLNHFVQWTLLKMVPLCK